MSRHLPSTEIPSQARACFRPRHITMLSIGGVIGAGLFVGSAQALAVAGPAVLLSYAFTGVLVVLVMRMLGEMAVQHPDSGSFSTYADHAIGHWAGFTIGWLYWWFWVLVIPVEASAAAAILHGWMPGVAIWVFALAITLVLTLSNLWSVRSYGEFEFWLATIKVVAIVVFLLIGVAALVGVWPGRAAIGLTHFHDRGGFMPQGPGAVVGAMLITVFSFFGSEIVTIAAAESEHPQREIVRATKAVVWRIALFYLASILVVAAIVPWNDPTLVSHGSYQRALEHLRIAHARAWVDAVVLVAVASCLNSALYTASRMICSLACRGDAPARLGRVTAQGTPRAAVWVSMVFGFLMVGVNALAPGEVFRFLLATSGAVALLVYLVIAVSQWRSRARGVVPLTLKMWGYPWLTAAVIFCILAILALMLWREDSRAQGLATLVLAGLVLLAAWGQARCRARRAP